MSKQKRAYTRTVSTNFDIMSCVNIECLIFKAINTIRNDEHRRPTEDLIYQNVSRNCDNLENEEFSVAFEKLEKENKIYNKGKDGKESFFVLNQSNESYVNIDEDKLSENEFDSNGHKINYANLANLNSSSTRNIKVSFLTN